MAEGQDDKVNGNRNPVRPPEPDMTGKDSLVYDPYLGGGGPGVSTTIPTGDKPRPKINQSPISQPPAGSPLDTIE